ncbi:MAG TPA: NACHT domain-containing protein [Candidatus Kapabacteria bacterium]|nr:NACHT domain-containing protein [Candidatus Kapabacteria bacterium]
MGTFIGWLIRIIELLEKLVKIILEHQKEKRIYRRYIALKFENVDFLGQQTNRSIPPLLLEEIYVNTQVKEYTRWLQNQLHGNAQIDDNFVPALKSLYKKSLKQKKNLNLAILGPSGCGKTTLMKWLALQCTSHQENFFSNFIPVYFSLDKPGLDPADIYLVDNIKALVHKKLEEHGIKSSFFNSEFEKGKVLFLFDGLNKSAGDNYGRVMDWIQKQDFQGNILIISTRKTGPDDSSIPDFGPTFKMLAIQDFNIDDTRCFLEKWFRAVEIKITEASGQSNIDEAEKKARQKSRYLMQIIEDKNNKVFQLLAAQPLCLKTMAIILHNRDRLPTNLQELCRESFKVIINLMGNKYFPEDDNDSVEEIMEYLSYIAFFLMKNKRQEMGFPEIKAYLPMLIDEDQLASLLDDLVSKTGLLFKINGRYGFTYITFQEYLVAWYFIMTGNYSHIIDFRDDGKWNEVFKLFVNMAEEKISQQFFNDIIQGLEKKEYWRQMLLWDNCLLNLANEKMQNDLEIKFARQVLQILSGIEYNQITNAEDEKFIIHLYIHYPIFKHAAQFKCQAWALFYKAKHPLVQTLGSSIMHDVAVNEPEEGQILVTALKKRIADFEKKDILKRDDSIDFLYRNHNSIALIIALRKNLFDLLYALSKLKSPHLLIRYLFLLNFNNFPHTLDFMELLVLPELKETLGFLDTREFLKHLDFSASFDLWAVRDFMTLQGFVELQTLMDLRVFIDSPLYGHILHTLDRFENKFSKKLNDAKIIHKIDVWVNNAYERLNSLPDEKLLTFFPGTPQGEIDRFRVECMRLNGKIKN